jgi:lipoprotein
MRILSKLIIIIIAALSIVACRKDENTNDGERLLNLTLIVPEGE